MGKSLRDMIEDSNDPMFPIDDREFVLYLQDHKENILAQCTRQTLTPNEMAKYENRPRYFLYKNRLPPGAYWILCWLNDMSGPAEFKNKSVLLIPNFRQLEDLYMQYRTVSTGYKNMLEELES